tara:strand:+ start:1824 stop:2324 length:501 start_codon:yes stop_codon:yes gene_type:complete
MSDEKNEDLETLTETTPETTECEKEEPPKPKQYKKAGENDARRKKERTPAQIAAFEKCRQKREENRVLRRDEREKEVETKKKKTKEKIVKKAVRIKKKEVLEQAIVGSSDESGDESDPDIQAVKKYIKKKKQTRNPVKPKPAKPPPKPDESEEEEYVDSGPHYFFA